MHTVFRFLRQLLLTVLLLALLTLVAAGGYFAVTGHKLYESAIQVTPIDTLYSSISSREGFVPYAQLPQTYINAVISAEDSRFTHHKGVDPVSIARALVTDLRTGSFAEGGSTITQQLAKNTLFTQEKHLARKAAEMFAALAIEKQYNKEQIFEMYVNTIYFGSGHYGIGEAAQGYFGKTPLQLTDAEAVMLAGLPNAPSAYSPNSSPDLAVKRMQVVLNRMVGCKKLTREQADALAAEAVTLKFLPFSGTQKAPRNGKWTRCAVLFYGIWFGKGGIMLSRRRDLRRSLPVILSYQRISAKVLCIRESFMNPDVSYSGAFMLSTMLIFFTCRRMTKQTASVNSMVSATLSR